MTYLGYDSLRFTADWGWRVMGKSPEQSWQNKKRNAPAREHMNIQGKCTLAEPDVVKLWRYSTASQAIEMPTAIIQCRVLAKALKFGGAMTCVAYLMSGE